MIKYGFCLTYYYKESNEKYKGKPVLVFESSKRGAQ